MRNRTSTRTWSRPRPARRRPQPREHARLRRRSEEHTSELQSRGHLVCRLLLEKKIVSWMPGWIANTLTKKELDLAKAGGYTTEKTETLLQGFDKNVADARAAIQAAKDGDFAVNWSLKRGGHTIFTQPRGPVVRNHLSHFSHHRGHLPVLHSFPTRRSSDLPRARPPAP